MLSIELLTRECFRSFDVLPGAELIERGGLFGVANDVPLAFFNGIANTRIPAEEVDARVDEVLAQFGTRPFRWWVTPDTRPETLAETLLARGMRKAYDAVAMSADLTAPIQRADAPVRIRRVTDRALFEPWLDVFATVFERSPEEREHWARAYEAIGFGDGLPWLHFLGFSGDRPVAIASAFVAGDIAGVYNVATLDEARGQGIGSAMTLAALRHARDHGAVEALLQASEMAENVYRAIGFRDECTVTALERDTP